MERPPELIDDVFGEILLRLPPGDPACLVRASLVCKPWRRLLSDPAFLRRYRAFHGAPPLLGFFRNFQGEHFVATTGASPISPLPLVFRCRECWFTMDCRHGRTLHYRFETNLIVWEPITGEQHRVPPPGDPSYYDAAAVLCGVDGCDHLDCRGGPFLVVFLCTYGDKSVKWASIYSSETDEWSASTSIQLDSPLIDDRPGLLVGDAFYFGLNDGKGILKYDLVRRGLSVINAPDVYQQACGIVVTGKDKHLGFAGLKDGSLYLWLWQAAADGSVGWTQDKVIKIETLLPILEPSTTLRLSGFVEGTDTIIISTYVGVFAVKLNSREVRKLDDTRPHSDIIPYTSFYTPDLAKVRLRRP